MITTIIILTVILLFSAFFSGMEIAFVTSNKLRIELDKKQGGLSSRIISFFLKKPGDYISSMLVGNNVVMVIYGMLMSDLLTPPISKFVEADFAVILLQTLISTIIILFIGEFIPKTIFRLNSNFALKLFAVPVFFLYIIFYPVSKLTILLSNFFIKNIFKVKISKEHSDYTFGKIDLNNLLEETEHNPDKTKAKKINAEIKQEIKIFKNALDFSNIKVRECIVPRNEIEAIEIESDIEELKQKFIETGFSKILVYQNSIDNIQGYVHNLSLFKEPKDIRSIISDIIIAPETMTANYLLDTFFKQHKSIALVVDEFGGTAGIVTTEDIMEEIFGEIDDEFDESYLEENKISDDVFIFSGRIEIDYVNEKYKLNIPECSDYETIAGYILYNHKTIPEENDEILIDKYKFIILKVVKPRIDLIKLIITE